jgi:hypothetical protein
MVELVVQIAFERDCRGEVALANAAVRDLVADWPAREDLERVEVEVDRMRRRSG